MRFSSRISSGPVRSARFRSSQNAAKMALVCPFLLRQGSIEKAQCVPFDGRIVRKGGHCGAFLHSVEASFVVRCIDWPAPAPVASQRVTKHGCRRAAARACRRRPPPPWTGSRRSSIPAGTLTGPAIVFIHPDLFALLRPRLGSGNRFKIAQSLIDAVVNEIACRPGAIGGGLGRQRLREIETGGATSYPA